MNITLLIDGEAVEATGGATFERRDPVTGDVATRAAAASVADALTAVAAAERAFAAWSTTGPSLRRSLLLKAADLLEARTEEFVRVGVAETGATGHWIGFNIHLSAGMLREAATLTTRITGQVIPSDKPGTLALGIRQPAGVCLGIAPWNAPIILAVRAIATPLACGNTVILKSSEMCPGLHRLIGDVMHAAGFPSGVVNVISNAPESAAEIVEALIAAPAVRRVNFTGSTRVGRRIAELCAREIKPAVLELGGKAPFVVLDDADIDGAVDAAAFGAFANQGQICMSTERIIVHQAVADVFVEKLAAKARALPAGNPRDHVVLGALVSLAAAEKMDALVSDAVAKGAVVVAGGRRDGVIVEATVLDHVTPAMRIYAEESFGPVKPVVRVASLEEAIACANDTEYGLASAVFTRDVRKGLAVAARIRSGICHINGPTVQDEPQMPFGGVKASGWGRFGGDAGIAEFTDLRWVTIEDPAQAYPF